MTMPPMSLVGEQSSRQCICSDCQECNYLQLSDSVYIAFKYVVINALINVWYTSLFYGPRGYIDPLYDQY